jgi:hypothetical protein
MCVSTTFHFITARTNAGFSAMNMSLPQNCTPSYITKVSLVLIGESATFESGRGSGCTRPQSGYESKSEEHLPVSTATMQTGTGKSRYLIYYIRMLQDILCSILFSRSGEESGVLYPVVSECEM